MQSSIMTAFSKHVDNYFVAGASVAGVTGASGVAAAFESTGATGASGAVGSTGVAAAALSALVVSSCLAELLQAVKANAAIAITNNFFIFLFYN